MLKSSWSYDFAYNCFDIHIYIYICIKHNIQYCYMLRAAPGLTHGGLVMPDGDEDLGQHWPR